MNVVMEEGLISTLSKPKENLFCFISYFSHLFNFCAPVQLENWLSAYYSSLTKLMSQLKHLVPELSGLCEGGNGGSRGEVTVYFVGNWCTSGERLSKKRSLCLAGFFLKAKYVLIM